MLGLSAAASAALVVGFSTAGAQPAKRRVDERPNIVFVLTDDLSWNLVRFMPHVLELQRQGATFTRYFVTDSLCCPSRASIFTGEYPHDTRVFTNNRVDGGFRRFHALGEERDTFATQLQRSGYLTGFMGKYLNGYAPRALVDGRPAYVPQGWNEWDVAGYAYSEFHYSLDVNGRLERYGTGPRDYLTDVLATKGERFIARAAATRKPFLLELATFAPHSPYTPAPRNAHDFPHLRAPRSPAYDEADLSDKPGWLRYHPPLTRAEQAVIDTDFRERAQAVEAVDRLLAGVESALARSGVRRNTYVFFSSDNGYHMGEHRLLPGKQTAFETDTRVPLIVAGPRIQPGRKITQIAQNVDLYPTFVDLAHDAVPSRVDGQSLEPLLHDTTVPAGWRDAALIEHHGPDIDLADPDHPRPDSGNPPSYEALRFPGGIYIEYDTGAREYYDLRHDPFELDNVAPKLDPGERAFLHSALSAFEHCHGSASCSRAWSEARDVTAVAARVTRSTRRSGP
jgi:arylsulfatase A-like enzyme